MAFCRGTGRVVRRLTRRAPYLSPPHEPVLSVTNDVPCNLRATNTFWQDGRDSLKGNDEFAALQHPYSELLDSIVWFPITSAPFKGRKIINLEAFGYMWRGMLATCL
jgi:hypothetical protein